MSAALMDKLTGGQTGGKPAYKTDKNATGDDMIEVDDDLTIPPKGYSFIAPSAAPSTAGGRHRKSHRGHKGNSWLAHVKATMKLNSGKSFKQVLKIAKKSYKKSQSQSSSQSQSGGKRRKGNGNGKGKGTRKGQYGGCGGKVAGVGASASPYV